MVRKIIALTLFIVSFAALVWASPSLFSILGENSNAAEAYDSSRYISFSIKEDPIRDSIKEKLDETKRLNAKVKQREMITSYLVDLVANYELKAMEKAEAVIEDTYPDPIEGKVAYLTFDDGPSPNITPQILEVLKAYDIKATFFVVGSMADKFPEILKSVWDNGHIIGNHTYSHVYDYIYRSTANFLTDLEKADKTFKRILGDNFQTNVMRFPGGTHAGYKRPFVAAVEEAGYMWYDWNTVNGDSELKYPTKDYILGRFMKTYGKRDIIVVLMHDAEGKQPTVDTLPVIIEHLKNEGYSFDTLDNFNN